MLSIFSTCTPKFIAALLTIARTWKQTKCPPTDEWIKKMWYIYTMEYILSHKKERNWAICSDVDGPRVCHTEWSKSERKKQIPYINTYIWNLEKWYWRTYWQGRNRDRRRERTCGHGREGEAGTNWESSIDVYTLPCVKQIASGKLLHSTGRSARCSLMT